MLEQKKNKGKNPGKMFEEDFIKSFPTDMFIYRLRDSAGAWGSQTGGKTRFTATNICDFIVHNSYRGEALLLELKSTKQKSLSFSNLKNNQIEGLFKASQYSGVKAYFIINFRRTEETYAIPAEQIKSYIEKGERKSFPLDWIRQQGIKIEQELKRTRYRYNLDKLLN